MTKIGDTVYCPRCGKKTTVTFIYDEHRHECALNCHCVVSLSFVKPYLEIEYSLKANVLKKTGKK